MEWRWSGAFVVLGGAISWEIHITFSVILLFIGLWPLLTTDLIHSRVLVTVPLPVFPGWPSCSTVLLVTCLLEGPLCHSPVIVVFIVDDSFGDPITHSVLQAVVLTWCCYYCIPLFYIIAVFFSVILMIYLVVGWWWHLEWRPVDGLLTVTLHFTNDSVFEHSTTIHLPFAADACRATGSTMPTALL